ncbi:flagellar basal body rod protein FlgB [Sulfitobacter aestuarii]|uniref:Flagellar basal body rod protein FlgB n=1 Tax=Sulfitobacter aestuarii TaxID=2161676 RepID=A0ABW5U4C4_9RHOB
MEDSKVSWFQTASQRLTWLSQRQAVLAENIANADTPDYKARDVQSFEDYLNAPAARRGEVAVDYTGTSWGSSIDGNNVVVEEQAILAAETAGQYRLAARLYRKGHELMAIAAGSK